MTSLKADKKCGKKIISKNPPTVMFNKLAIIVVLNVLVSRNVTQAIQYEPYSYSLTGYSYMSKDAKLSIYDWYSLDIGSNTWIITFDDEYYIDFITIVAETDSSGFEVTFFSSDQKVQQGAGSLKKKWSMTILNTKYCFDYKFAPVQAKFMKIKSMSNVRFYVVVYLTGFQKPSYFKPLDGSQYQIFEASYYSDDRQYTLQEIKNMLNITSSSYFSISPVEKDFDVSPVAWFTLKMNKVQLVHQFIIMSGAYNGLNSVGGVWLSFRLNDDRDFIDYTENNQTKIFIKNYIRSQWFSYNLLNPFMASEIQILVDSGDPLMYFTVDFRFIEPIEFSYEKPVVGVFNFLANDIISIKFNKLLLISGIQFDNIKNLLRFCIYYNINNQFVPYRDSNLFNDNIQFHPSPKIYLHPFRTSEILLSHLKWFMNVSQNITITVQGDRYLSADYTWINAKFISYDSYVEYTSSRGNQKLYGDSKYLKKSNLQSRLMSNHLGPDCFTQPHLCVNGFTIQLDAAVRFSSEDSVKTFCMSDYLYKGSNSSVLKFGNQLKTFLFFDDFLLAANAKVKDFYLNIGVVKSSTGFNFQARIYIILVPTDTMLTYIRNNIDPSINVNNFDFANYQSFMFNGSVGAILNFNLTYLLKRSRDQYYGLLSNLCIMVIPENLSSASITVNPNEAKLLITYSSNVVGDVRPLNNLTENSFTTVDNQYFNNLNVYIVDISFDQAYFMTGIKLWTESPIDVDLLFQAKYSDTPLYAIYFTIKKVFLNGGENQYVALNGVLKAKYFRIVLSNKVVINYQFYGTENTYSTAPIISAGLGGYQKSTHGYGFQIHLMDDKIAATVVTKNGRYDAEMPSPSEAPFKLTLVWSKDNDSLSLYHNDNLKNIGNFSENKYLTNSSFFNEYILVYADYYNNQSELQASLSYIKMWSIPLSSVEISQILSEDPLSDYSYPDSTPPSGFNYGSDCYCINDVCPCETLESTEVVEFVSRYESFEMVSEDDYNEEFIYFDIESLDNSSYIYFDDIVLDFQSVHLTNVNLIVNLQSISSALCNSIFMQFLNSSEEVQVQWCIPKNIDGVIASPDLTALLTQLLKTTSFTPPLTILFKIKNVVVQPKSFLKIVYEAPRPGGFIHASAAQSSPDDVLTTLSFNITGACISFKFKFGGTGFVNLVVFGHGTNVKKRLAFFYRQEGQDRWVEKNLDLGHNYSVVEFVAFKNGLGIGYIAFGSFQFFQSCSVNETSADAERNTTQIVTYSFSNPVVMVTDYYDFQTTLKNVFINQGSNCTLSSFFNSLFFMAYNQQLTFQEWSISDFTILFWFKNSTYQSIILNMAYSSGDAITISFSPSSIFVIYNTIKKSVVIESSIWHYVILKYNKRSSLLFLQIDYKTEVVIDGFSFPENSSVVLQLPNNLFCFQVYKEILHPSAIKAVQFCPIKQWDLACTSRQSQCEWCNPFYGQWELFPWEYNINNKKIECFQDGYNSIFYQPFNAINNNKFIAGISNGYEVDLSTEVKMVNGFIYNGLSTTASSVTISDQSVSNFFTQCCPVFSAWIKQSCESFSEEKPILTTSVVILFCKKRDSSTTKMPIMAFFNNCFYDLPGRSGLWYNFAFVINQTISFYIDGIFINSICRSVSTLLQQSLSNEIKVFSVGSFPTLIDEVFITNNTEPNRFFWLQLTGYPNADKVKQTTRPFLFKFCSSETWEYDAFPPGSYLYEKIFEKIQIQITQLMASVKEVLLTEVISLQGDYFNATAKSQKLVCGKFNVYFMFESKNLLSQVLGLKNSFILNIFLENSLKNVTENDDYLEIYPNNVTYNVLQQQRSAVVLSLVIVENSNYPVYNISVQYRKFNNGTTKELWSNNPLFIYIDGLETFQVYQVCFSFQTFRKRLNALCVLQNETFMSAEGGPSEYPKLSCSLNENMKAVNCNLTQISTMSWNGIPYSYEIVYKAKGNEDSCQKLSEFDSVQYSFTIKYNSSDFKSDLKFSINTSDFHFVDLCIIGYATTNNGNGIGVSNYTVVRTQREAPDEAPKNFTAVPKGASIQFNWNIFENTTDAWNDYKIPGFYQLSYGLVTNSLENINFIKKNLSNNQFVLTDADFCYFYIASVNGFSIAPGPESRICLLGHLTEPICMTPLIMNFYVASSTNAIFITKSFLPSFFRGTSIYWLFHVDAISQYFDPGPLSDEYLQKPVYLKYSLEKYSGMSSQCSEEDLLNYFTQSTDFHLNLVGLHPFTKYQVSVQPCNEIGCGDKSNSVEFQTYSDKPSCEPTLLLMQNLSSTSMQVTWSKLNSSCSNIDLNFISYTLKCNGNQGSTILKKLTSTLVVLLNLKKFEQICCNVAASNINGTGPFSTSRCEFTAEGKPEIAPICSDILMSSFSATLKLLPPNGKMNGLVLGINAQLSSNSSRVNVSYLTKNATCCLQENLYSYNFYFDASDLNNGLLNISFEKLRPFYVYFVQLKYFTSIGFGPWSSIYQLLTEEGLSDAPSFISNYTNNVRIIRVNWDAVPPENSHGIITSYEVCRKQLYFNGSVGPNYCFKQSNCLILEFNLTNLDRGSTHNISVAACNNAGCGKKIFMVASSMGFVDGEWMSWSYWSKCSTTCDEGIQWRTRSCTAITDGGYSCSGNDTEHEVCQLEKCFVDGNWSEWSMWSDCSQTCNEGTKMRKRICTPPLKRFICMGSNISYETCFLRSCSSFVLGREGITDCNSVCEEKELVCSRTYSERYNDSSIFLHASSPILCNLNITAGSLYSSDLDPSFNSAGGFCYGYINIPKDVQCISEKKFTQKNMHRLCNCINKGDIGFDEWLEWSLCSETCGEKSFMIRKRICHANCSGISLDRKACNVPVCPVDGEWGSWGPYGDCNATCGYGVYTRTRNCDNPIPIGSGTPCQGLQEDILPECNAFPCPVNGGFSEWAEWSICDQPCGNGEKTKMRYCNKPVPMNNGLECNGSFTMSESCVLPPCKAVEVNLVQRTLEKWFWKMYIITSEEAQNFSLQFKESVFAYFRKNNLKGLNDVVVNKLQMGSVIVNYTLLFDYLHGQMVEYLDGINATGKLMNITIVSTQYSSKDVNCPAPFNISVLLNNQNKIFISWLRKKCNSTEIWLYIYYKDITAKTSVWEWKGIPLDSQNLVLSDLVPFHQYKAYMLTAMSNGNSLPSTIFFIQAPGKGPNNPPSSVTTESMKSTEIYVEWAEISELYSNSKVLGYKIRYKVYLSSESLTEVETQNGFNAFTLKKLKPFTLYYIEVYGYNIFGPSPPIFSMCKTIEDVPSASVPNIKIYDMQSIDWWSVSWDPIPAEYANGVLRGYKLTYYLSYQSGKEVSGEKIKKIVELDSFTRYYKQRNLQNYAIYRLSIAGFTSAGNGPSEEFEAKTCKCTENLFANWYVKEPFTSAEANDTGFFMEVLEDLVVQSCGSCKSYPSKVSKLYFRRSKFGNNPVKKSEYDLKSSINDDVHLSFPIFGRSGREVAPNSTFVLLIKSPGIAAVVRDENIVDIILLKLVLNVFTVWAFLLITCLIASIFGMLVWFTDQFSNPNEFIIGNAWKGPLIGFWFSFITMTTVGYGDMAPRSILARVVVMIWFIAGMILNSITIGFVVINLTSTSLPPQFILYDTKVAALESSFEHRTALIKNARLSSEIHYSSIEQMLNDLEKKVVDMVYVDTFSLMGYKKTLEEKSLKMAFIDSKIPVGYGFALSGLTVVLDIDIKSFIEDKSAAVTAFAQSLHDRFPELVVENPDETVNDMFSEKSMTYKKSLIFLGYLIAGMTFLGLCVNIKQGLTKIKVRNEPTVSEDIENLASTISAFREQFCGTVEEMTKTHEQEYVVLTGLKKKYKRKVEWLGIVEANRLSSMSDKYRIH